MVECICLINKATIHASRRWLIRMNLAWAFRLRKRRTTLTTDNVISNSIMYICHIAQHQDRENKLCRRNVKIINIRTWYLLSLLRHWISIQHDTELLTFALILTSDINTPSNNRNILTHIIMKSLMFTIL